MKKIIFFLIITFVTATLSAQSPQKMSYQAVVRGESYDLVTNQTVGMKISILQGSAEGNTVYSETFSTITNSNGLLSIEFGGEPGFETVNWADGPYFIKTETDPTGGTDYTISGTSQLLSVPYALYSASTGDTSTWRKNNNHLFFNTGQVGIGTFNPKSLLEIFSASLPSEVTIRGQGLSYAASALVFEVATNEGDRRGSGVFLLDSAGANEWFVGRPYGNYSGATSDMFVIQRHPDNSEHSLKTAGLFDGNGNSTGTERLFSINSSGNVGVGTGSVSPASRLQIADGDVYLSDINSGIILTSADGNCWRITVNNDGILVTESMICP